MIVTGCDRMVKYGTQVEIVESDSLIHAKDQINEFIKNRCIWKIIPVDHESKFAFMIWYMITDKSN